MIVYAPSFPQKVPAGAHPAGHFRHGDAVGLLVTHKHLCLLAAVDERLQQSSCGNRRSSGTLACIYNQYIHFACPTFSPYLRLQTGFLKTPYCFPECSLSYAKIAQGEYRNKAGKQRFTRLGTAEPMPILCKDSANEWNESLLSDSRVQPILCKDTKMFYSTHTILYNNTIP